MEGAMEDGVANQGPQLIVSPSSQAAARKTQHTQINQPE